LDVQSHIAGVPGLTFEDLVQVVVYDCLEVGGDGRGNEVPHIAGRDLERDCGGVESQVVRQRPEARLRLCRETQQTDDYECKESVIIHIYVIKNMFYLKTTLLNSVPCILKKR
jgi:hypothetical protein